MHPNLTNVYNPLINAVQAFRQNNPTKGTTLIDSLVDTLFPDDNGEIWNPAAGNMFRRAVYLLFDYYIEQEKYIRYLGRKNNTPQEVIDQEIDKNYSKITLYNVYSLIGELAATVSKDVKFINVDPSAPPANEKDMLTLIFDAMAMLPHNTLREKAITANNAIKQIASAEQTIAGIYATLLTGLSVYADDTAIALMSGSISDSFDVAGLGFPRRIGVCVDDAYAKKFRITDELYRWSIYKDAKFTQKYEGKAFEHEGRVPDSNWIWGFFAGIIPTDVAYLKLDIEAGNVVAKSFYFKFVKGYKRFEGITYVTNPITHKKIVSGGTLIEIDPKTGKPYSTEFTSKELDLLQNSYHEVTKPAIVANQVFYSEQPKAVFAITPPHLQVYQKHILVIIKQILDEQYSNSYVTKQNRKPIVGTRLMLEEFGNIRSGKKGIPDIDTATSIALGQDVQLTFVLQSFQQLRAIYGDDVEKILRANSSNTIFLKSNDKELIDELVRLSGSRHKQQAKGKSVSRKMGDVITAAEPVINYNSEDTETTALTSNDLMFLAGAAPGNAITFSSGEMAIVNKLSTIMPMAAGLHKHLPEPADGQYSDATMPTIVTGSSGDYHSNTIDGMTLVKARVAQAHIWNDKLKPKVEELAKREGLTLDERDNSIADMVMNTVYEMYDRQAGQGREDLSEPEPYWQKALKIRGFIRTVSDSSLDQATRLNALKNLREALASCVMDDNLNDLTAIYRDTTPNSEPNAGYNSKAITRFITAMIRKYPKPADTKTEKRDIFKDAAKNPNYKQVDPNADNKPFHWMDSASVDALQQYCENVASGDDELAPGLSLVHEDGTTEYKFLINGKPLFQLESEEPDAASGTFAGGTISEDDAVSDLVCQNAALLNILKTIENDETYK